MKKHELDIGEIEKLPYLSLKQAAEYLQVSLMTIHRWEKAGKLPVLRIERSVRIPRKSIDNLQNQLHKEV